MKAKVVAIMLAVFMFLGGTVLAGPVLCQENPENTTTENGSSVVIYYQGSAYNDAWVEGYSSRNGAQSNESDHLYLFASSSLPAHRTYETAETVSLDGIHTLEIEWENTGYAGSHQNRSTFGIAESPGTLTIVHGILKTDYFGRVKTTLDVSGYTGEYHIVIRATDNSWGAEVPSEIRVFRVQGYGLPENNDPENDHPEVGEGPPSWAPDHAREHWEWSQTGQEGPPPWANDNGSNDGNGNGKGKGNGR